MPPLSDLLRPLVGTPAVAAPPMEPIPPSPATTDLQLVTCIAAWEQEARCGRWSEPDPVGPQFELLAPEPEPSLLGSGWDSWSWGDHWLDEPQVEELPGFRDD